MTTMNITEAAKLLNTSTRRAAARLAALGYTVTCSRCGGSGEYSWNQTDGSKCFKCGGAKRVLAPLTAAVVTEAVARIAAGELDAYFARAKAAGEIKSVVASVQSMWMSCSVCVAYTAFSRDPNVPAAVVVESPLFRAQGLVNHAMETVWAAARNTKLDAVARMTQIEAGRAMIMTVCRAWDAFAV